MLNALTIDVEDWFHVHAFTSEFPVSTWESQRARVLRNTIKTLEILKENDTLATFFILGWVAEKHPEVVSMIHEQGHEIASHSQYHRLVYDMDRDEFKRDLQQSLLHIEQAADVTVKGYRAPCFSIKPEIPWVWEVLSECGIEYDSSVFPVKHDTYGTPSAPRFAYKVEPAERMSILEVPPSTVRILGMNVPMAGGGYLRMFPYWFTRRSIRSINAEGHPAVIYFHPWELDPDQTRVKTNLKSRLRHYTNLRLFESKLRRLLAEFRFSTLSSVFERSICRAG